MKIPTMVLYLCWQFRIILGTMSGNVPTIKNSKMTCGQLLKVLEGIWLANCAHMCVYENECKSFSFNQKQGRCELYRINSASAVTGDMVEEDGVVLIDIEHWPGKRTGACAKKPCGEQKVCLPDQESNQCTESQNFPCPVGWVKFEEKCYYFNRTLKNYTEAQAHCKQNGGKLTEPRTISANKCLKSELSRQGLGTWWMGLNDMEIEGDWVWSCDGTRPSYSGWGTGQPDRGTGANCALFSGLYWGDRPCWRTLKSICELI